MFRKNCVFFTIHCSNPTLAYIVVRDLQSSQRNVSVQTLLLAGNYCTTNSSRELAMERWQTLENSRKKTQYLTNTLYKDIQNVLQLLYILYYTVRNNGYIYHETWSYSNHAYILNTSFMNLRSSSHFLPYQYIFNIHILRITDFYDVFMSQWILLWILTNNLKALHQHIIGIHYVHNVFMMLFVNGTNCVIGIIKKYTHMHNYQFV